VHLAVGVDIRKLKQFGFTHSISGRDAGHRN
jgi:hypothetical protein